AQARVREGRRPLGAQGVGGSIRPAGAAQDAELPPVARHGGRRRRQRQQGAPLPASPAAAHTRPVADDQATAGGGAATRERPPDRGPPPSRLIRPPVCTFGRTRPRHRRAEPPRRPRELRETEPPCRPVLERRRAPRLVPPEKRLVPPEKEKPVVRLGRVRRYASRWRRSASARA